MQAPTKGKLNGTNESCYIEILLNIFFLAFRVEMQKPIKERAFYLNHFNLGSFFLFYTTF